LLAGDRPTNDLLKDSFPLFQQGEFDFYFENAPWPIGLQSTLPNELKKKIAASVISEALGYSSVDGVMKRYLEDIAYPDGNHNRLDWRIRTHVSSSMDVFHGELEKVARLPNKPFGSVLSEWTLCRAHFSMDLYTYDARTASLGDRGLRLRQ
jgi:hypothetical protein